MTLDNSSSLCTMLATLFYLASTLCYFIYLFMQKDKMQKTAFIMISSGFSAHLAALFLNSIIMKTLPVHNLQQTLFVAALALSGGFIILRVRLNLKILGIFASPLVLIMMIAALLLPQAQPLKTTLLSGFWLISHIALIFSGEAALALACGAGILYLIQEYAIKHKKRGFFYKRLPPLDLLDRTSYTCVVTGFALLTFGLITGLVYAKSAWGRFWGWDPKEIWSAVTWLVYAALLHGRLTAGWQGRRSAVMTIIGFCVLMFTFLGVNFFIGGHHQVFTK